MGSVAVLGMGQMGSALARSFLSIGETVTVWNRTAARCEPLRQLGASVATSGAEAAAAAETIVICLLDYAAANAVVRALDVTAVLKDRFVVQLSTGTADDARDASRWAEDNGIEYLDGAIFGLPGADGCRIFCSGPAALFERSRALLAGAQGEALHVGDDIAAANTLDEAVLIMYEGILFSFLQAAAFSRSQDLPLDRLEEMATWLHDRYGPHVGDVLARVRSGEFPVDVETPLSIWTAAIAQHVRFAQESNVDPTFAEALLQLARKAERMGLADRVFSAVYEAFRTA